MLQAMRLISISWLWKFIGSDAAHPGPSANDLEDGAVMFVDRVAQDGVMPREQGGQLIGIMLRQFSAAFDVGEEKSNCSSWISCHADSVRLIAVVRSGCCVLFFDDQPFNLLIRLFDFEFAGIALDDRAAHHVRQGQRRFQLPLAGDH